MPLLLFTLSVLYLPAFAAVLKQTGSKENNNPKHSQSISRTGLLVLLTCEFVLTQVNQSDFFPRPVQWSQTQTSSKLFLTTCCLNMQEAFAAPFNLNPGCSTALLVQQGEFESYFP